MAPVCEGEALAEDADSFDDEGVAGHSSGAAGLEAAAECRPTENARSRDDTSGHGLELDRTLAVEEALGAAAVTTPREREDNEKGRAADARTRSAAYPVQPHRATPP